MASSAGRVLLLIAMIVVIFLVDLTLVRASRWTMERLVANIGIVLLFGGFYFRFFSRR